MNAKLCYMLDTGGFNEVCETCKFYSETIEHHPYGSTTASEAIGDCTCDNDSLCPRIRTPKWQIGQHYKSPGKHPRVCKVIDILTTFNSKGEQVKFQYVSQHEFAGQIVTDYEVPEATITRGID